MSDLKFNDLPKINAPLFDINAELSSLGGSKKYKRVVLRLNQVMSVAAERLQDIVETRHKLRQVLEERDVLEKQLQNLRIRNKQMKLMMKDVISIEEKSDIHRSFERFSNLNSQIPKGDLCGFSKKTGKS